MTAEEILTAHFNRVGYMKSMGYGTKPERSKRDQLTNSERAALEQGRVHHVHPKGLEAKHDAIDSLVGKIDAGAFERAFGAPVSELETLVSANTVTIARLMELAPPGTVDPSPFLYDSTFYGMAGIISVAAVANSMITKVQNPRYFIEPPAQPPLRDTEQESLTKR